MVLPPCPGFVTGEELDGFVPCLGKISNNLRCLRKPFGFRPAVYSVHTIRNLFSSIIVHIPKMNVEGTIKVCVVIVMRSVLMRIQIRMHEHKSTQKVSVRPAFDRVWSF